MTDETWVCRECDLGWNSERAAEACCTDDDRSGYEPSRARAAYILGYN